MTSSDERREVAERLRNEANGYRRNRAYRIRTEIDLGDVPGVFQDITHFCGLHGTVRCEDMLDRLADLIDPTCHVVGTTSEEGLYDGLTIFRHELSCGHTCETVWLEPPAYCDECGARVVSDDGLD